MKKYLLVSLFLFFSHSSFSAQSNWYAGVGFGSTSADVSKSGIEEALGILEGAPFGTPLGLGETWSSSTDDSDTGWTGFVGYSVNQNFTVEGGYVDLGEVSASASFSVPVGTDTITADADATGFNVALLGLYPVGSGSLFGKAGLLRWDVDASVTITNFLGQSVTLSDSDTGTDLLFGVGYQYQASQLGIRAEWTRYTDVGGDDIGESDVDWLGVSVIFGF